MNTRKKSTIKDVAKRAGVSPTTVSLVLNGRGSAIPVRTQERVRQAAKELSYHFDYNARAMVTKRTNIIGVIIPDLCNTFFAECVRNIQVELSELGYDVMLCNSEESAESDLKYLRLLAGRNVDGIIFTPSAQSLEKGNAAILADALTALETPCLFLDRSLGGDNGRVEVDNGESAYRAAKHLLECGHRKIGVITGPLSLQGTAERLAGCKRALAEYGAKLPSKYIYEGKYDYESGSKGAEALLATDVTALFAFSDMQAYGIYGYMRRTGRSVPEDCSVIGFDDIFYSSELHAPLTTMRQPVREMAGEAARAILAMIAGERVGTVRFPAELIVRGSVRSL